MSSLLGWKQLSPAPAQFLILFFPLVSTTLILLTSLVFYSLSLSESSSYQALEKHNLWDLFKCKNLSLSLSIYAFSLEGQHIKKQTHYFANIGPSSQTYGFSSGHVWMWKLDYKESWVPKNWCFWTVVLEKTLESPLDCKEIQPVHPKRDQSWMFIGRTDAEAETLILWPPHVKSWLIGKDSDAGKDWRQEKGMTEDEMVGWNHGLNGHVFG